MEIVFDFEKENFTEKPFTIPMKKVFFFVSTKHNCTPILEYNKKATKKLKIIKLEFRIQFRPKVLQGCLLW